MNRMRMRLADAALFMLMLAPVGFIIFIGLLQETR